MSSLLSGPLNLAVSLLGLTHTTDIVAHFVGARPFLPALFVQRFCPLGGFSEAHFAAQLDGCASFSDAKWAAYWSDFASEHLDQLATDEVLCGAWVESIKAGNAIKPPQELLQALARGASLLTGSGPLKCAVDIEKLAQGVSATQAAGFRAVDHLLKSMTYYFCAAWPGKRPRRQEAYWKSKRVFDVLLSGVAVALGVEFQRQVVETHGESVDLYVMLPADRDGRKLQPIFFGEGLEGTNQELIMPMLRTHAGTQAAYFFAEMPGTYSFKEPMKAGRSESIYKDILTHVLQHPDVEGSRLGYMGLSFGAHWAIRMALCDPRIKAAVINGPPNNRSFSLLGGIGMPEIMMQALANASGSLNPLDMYYKLSSLALGKDQLAKIKIPILVVNGDNDTLCSTQDSVDLYEAVAVSTLQLYPGDDHCAMAHFEQHIILTCQFLLERT